jgi:putative alpha-1,2-mannosidase
VEGEKNGFKHDRYYTTWTAYTNQPGTGMAHLFNHAGYPWLTQKWVRKVKDAYGDITPYGGYEDDEDQGQMGALGVLMAIGLFEIDGGTSRYPVYEISTPIFSKVRIKLNPDYYDGEEFTLIANNNTPRNVYIQSARLNRKVHDKYWFSHQDFANGGTLVLELDSVPNKTWGL